MRAHSGFSRKRTDLLLDEIVALLAEGKAHEFRPFFEILFAKLRARNAISGGEEMLRLRAYEKIQTLLRKGVVKKTGSFYQVVPEKLALLREEIAAPERPKLRGRRSATKS